MINRNVTVKSGSALRVDYSDQSAFAESDPSLFAKISLRVDVP
ncbi:MAG: hypothetical protein R3C05_16040 [Pirellulaceae bacterium]